MEVISVAKCQAFASAHPTEVQTSDEFLDGRSLDLLHGHVASQQCVQSETAE